MTVAVNVQGTLLQVGDKPPGTPTDTGSIAGENWTTIAGCKDLNGPDFTSTDIDVTSHDSTGGYKESQRGLKDGQQLGFQLLFNPNQVTHAEVSGMLSFYVDGLYRHWRLVFPVSPSRKWVVNGYVKEFKVKAPVDGVMTADMVIRISGAPNFNA